MEKTSSRIPLLNGAYYKELLRELKVIGIIFAAVQLLFGFSGAFGSGVELFSLLIGQTNYRNILVLYFFVAGLHFFRAHIARSSWDFRGSLPIAKRTMFCSHLLATLTWAFVIIAANYVGALLGEGLKLIPVINAHALPAGFFTTAATLRRALFVGLMVYGGLILIASVVARAFSAILAIASALFVPPLYLSLASNVSKANFAVDQMLLPIGQRARSAVGLAALILGTLAVLALAYFAFSQSRAETFNKPARTAWIHVAIGLGFAMLLGLAVLNIGSLIVYKWSGAENRTSMTGSVIAAAVVMLLGYFFYMWISGRKFKLALKRLMFLPIAVLLIASALLITAAMNARWERIDCRAENIDHITVPGSAFENSPGNDFYDWDMLSLSSNGYSRGRSGAEKVELDDARLLRLMSEQFASCMDDDEMYGVLAQLIMPLVGSRMDYVDVALKDGTVWTIPVDSGTLRYTVADYAFENEEYTKRFTDLERFRHGSVLLPVGLGREFTKTLFEELDALAPEERLAIFSGDRQYYDYGTIEYEKDCEPEELSLCVGKITLVSPTYDHAIVLNLTNKLPRTCKLYYELISRRTRSARGYDEFLDRLARVDYDIFEGTILLTADGKVRQGGFTFLPGDPGYDEPYRVYARETSKLIGECLQANLPVEGAPYVLGVNIRYFLAANDGNSFTGFSFGSSTSSFANDDAIVYVGVDEATYNDLYYRFFSDGYVDLWEAEVITYDVFDGEK